MLNRTAFIALENLPYTADILYEYSVPSSLSETVAEGTVVYCPFGNGNRKTRGIVFKLGENENGKKLKPISDICQTRSFLGPDELKLAAYIKNKYFCTYFEAAKVIMPAGALGGTDSIFTLVGICPDEHLNRYFEENGGSITKKQLMDEAGKKTYLEVLRFVKLGVITQTTFTKGTVRDKVCIYLSLKEPAATEYEEKINIKPSEKTDKHLRLISFLRSISESPQKDLLTITGISASVVKTLVKYGVIQSEEKNVLRSPLKTIDEPLSNKPLLLNPSQKKALEEISGNLGSGKTHLLYGVTGSGKTHVFMSLIDMVLQQGKSALVLLPEISLTFQVVEIFYRRYGNRLSILHSALSQGERSDQWKRIQKGDSTIVVGTRSAVFAPMKNMGLIIIDEEQEHTYKSEMAPKYHAREIAAFRVSKQKALLLLASATPSFESYYRALNGKIGLSVLPERFNRMPLPKVLVTDMSNEILTGNKSIISRTLARELETNLKKKEQSILFINRRGYNSFVSCPKCKLVFKCESCGIPLTYHATTGRLVCHYCGYAAAAPSLCPSCAAATIKYSGIGTQKVEEELKTLFPELRILRMDADTVTGRDSRDKILTAFRENKYDILLGTQMITKGLDFANVTLVGVLMADMSLYSSDFRAYEKTFSLITQVIGRAGRAQKEGRAVIQTYSPSHTVLSFAFAQDYKGFYNQEVALRHSLVYPPYCDVCQLVFLADTLERATESAIFFTEQLKNEVEKSENKDIPVNIIRPKQTAVPLVNGRNRVRILIKCSDNAKTRRMLDKIYLAFLKNNDFKDITVGIDMNPSVIV